MRIGIAPEQLPDFLGDDSGGPYQAAAILLAVVVGTPTQARALIVSFTQANVAPGTDVVDVLSNLPDFPIAGRVADRVKMIRKREPVYGALPTYQAWAKQVARYSFETYDLFSPIDRTADGTVD